MDRVCLVYTGGTIGMKEVAGSPAFPPLAYTWRESARGRCYSDRKHDERCGGSEVSLYPSAGKQSRTAGGEEDALCGRVDDARVHRRDELISHSSDPFRGCKTNSALLKQPCELRCCLNLKVFLCGPLRILCALCVKNFFQRRDAEDPQRPQRNSQFKTTTQLRIIEIDKT
jgi:hypothetical protein